MRNGFVEAAVVIGVILLVVGVGTIGAWSTPSGAEDAVRASGVDNPAIGSWAPFRCSKDDLWCNHFTGTRNGQPVSGIVGCGLLKGCTIRY